uniref:Nicastrin n=1 Tax=Callorhinchus milii TaxID=7868 RepID=V9KKG2_CALMI
MANRAVILISLWLSVCAANSVERKIYIPVNATSPCVRLLNATHQIGCQSAMRGNTGILHLVANSSDLDWILSDGPNPPYIAVIEAPAFTRDILMRLKTNPRVSGVFLLSSDVPPSTNYSPDLKCPNEYFGVYTDDYGAEYLACNGTQWNPHGNSLSYEDFPFPVFNLMNSNESDVIRECYFNHNHPVNGTAPPFPLCAMQISAHMHGVTDTPTCMRRSSAQGGLSLSQDVMCDPLSDYNVWGSFHPVNQTGQVSAESKFIIAASRLDSRSFFWNEAPGADSPVSGFVTLLAAAQALRKVTDIQDLPKNILFMFFQGETFDYIGSSRMVYDMKLNKFPIALENIDSFVELNQVGIGAAIWMHSDPVSRRNETVNEEVVDLVKNLQEGGTETNLSLHEPSHTQPIPPSSFQRFLRERNIPGLVLTDHETAYSNRYYHSTYDTAENMGIKYPDNLSSEEKLNFVTETAKNISRLATTLARGLYRRAGGSSAPEDIEADPLLVSRMLYSFLIQPNNSWFESVLSSDLHTNLDKPLTFYVAVQSPVPVTRIVQQILGNVTGTVTNLTQENCTNGDQTLKGSYSYFWIDGDANKTESHCVQAYVWLTKAQSPAFHLKDYTSRAFSTWTESRWKDISARIYLVSSKQLEIITLVTGIGILALSFLVTFLLSSKSDILFSTIPDTSPAAY